MIIAKKITNKSIMNTFIDRRLNKLKAHSEILKQIVNNNINRNNKVHVRLLCIKLILKSSLGYFWFFITKNKVNVKIPHIKNC